MTRDVMDRFMEKVDKRPDGCWLWTGTVTRTGYGRFSLRHATSTWAHRVSWRLFRGEIPDDLQLDHLCRVKHCVNPDHLEPVTGAENLRRGIAATRGVLCRNLKHDLTVPGSRLGDGRCGQCRRNGMRGWRAERKAKSEVRPGESFLMFLNLR